MCGITGFFSTNEKINASKYYTAHSLLNHRGPDDEGFVAKKDNILQDFSGDKTIEYFTNNPHINQLNETNLLLGQHRLAIIDLSRTGHQPYFDIERNYAMVYNGELFNYIELREELRSLGHVFKADNDVEVVLTAYLEWGSDAFNKFNGMWALAIFDLKKNTLVLSRDRFGIKPLYFYLKDDLLVFASEMKFIRSFIGENYFNVNKSKVKEYLQSMLLNNSEQTFWSEISELRPAHYLVLNESGIKIEKYWDYSPGKEKRSSDEALKELTGIFEDSLKLRMRSDVEVGTLLSGGLDSNAIVGKLFSLGLIKENEFKSFSAVFNEEIFSEKKYIDDTLAKIPLKPYFVTPDPESIEDDINDLLFYMEEPFRSLAVYSQHLLYRCVKEKTGVKVLLNGQGADELFGGYTEHYRLLFIDLIKSFKWKKFRKEFSLFKEKRNQKNSYIFNTGFLKQLLKSVFLGSNFNHITFKHITNSALAEYLKYDDRNAMAYSVEARVPFLDYRLVEFAFSLNSKFKISNFVNKKIQREMLKGCIPDTIIDRKDKQGFVSPQEIWQRNELKSVLDKVFYNKDLMSLIENYSGKNFTQEYVSYQKGNHEDWALIWRIFNLAKWFEYNRLSNAE